MGQLLTACSRCGVAMAPNAVLYDRDGKPLCDTCNNRQDLIETDKRAANNIRKASYATLGAGVFGLIAPVAHLGFLIACIVAGLTSGVFALQSLARGNERFTNYLSPTQRQVALVCTIAGIALLALSLMGANLGRIIDPDSLL